MGMLASGGCWLPVVGCWRWIGFIVVPVAFLLLASVIPPSLCPLPLILHGHVNGLHESLEPDLFQLSNGVSCAQSVRAGSLE